MLRSLHSLRKLYEVEEAISASPQRFKVLQHCRKTLEYQSGDWLSHSRGAGSESCRRWVGVQQWFGKAQPVEWKWGFL